MSLVLTAIAGFVGFQSSGEIAELMKLLYAYFALTTVVCALIAAGTRARTTQAHPIRANSPMEPMETAHLPS